MGQERKYPPFETRDRIRKWCDLQERAHSDVSKKLYSWGVFTDEIDQIIAELISDNYLNEERFARAFARGKFRIKKWGWKKIEIELKRKKVSSYSIALAKKELEDEDYLGTLQALIDKKRNFVKADTEWELNQKLIRFALGKGYSYEDVQKVMGDF